MATQIGTVKVIIGTVTAEAMDGQVRTLREGDILFADEILSTGLSGSIVIEYVGGQKVNIDPDVKLILEDIVNKQSATDDKNISETPDSEESSRVEYDLNEGNNLVTIHYLSPTATPDAGFGTKGVENKIINFSDNLLNIKDDGIRDLLLNYIGGDSVTADLKVLITDTVPIANADQGVVTEDGTIISSGNVITGTGGATADLVSFGTTVVGFAVGDTGNSLDGIGVGTLLEGTYGSIIISADGSYTYTLNNADPDTNALSDGDTVTDVFTYTIKDTDGDLTYTTVTININGSTDVIFNNSPVFDSASYNFNYAENTAAGTTIATVASTDADIADTVSYSIKTNVDDGSGNFVYAINSTTGAISLTAAGATSFANDFEAASNAHGIVVTATDGTNNTDVNVSLNEIDLNDNSPVFGEASYSFNYVENTAAGTTLDTVTATDFDEADTVSYSIKTNVDDGSGNLVYAINSTTGAISLTAAGATSFANDFETDSNAHNIVVTATDGSNTTDVDVSLNEMDVNEVGNRPIFGLPRYSFDYAENTAAGTTLDTVAATDSDIADTVTYSIKTNVDDGLGNLVYAINSTTGAISLTAAGATAFANDFETASNAHDIVVSATDGNNTTDVNVSFNETNVNEAPILDLDANNSTVGGADHVSSYALGQQGVSIGDVDVSISDVDSTIQSATITLTNAQAGDLLFADSLPSGISVSAYNAVTGVITLTGVATTSVYQSALEAIKFYNTDTGANTTDRTIDVSVVDNSGASSNTAATTISVASNSLSVSTQALVEEGNSAIFRVELAEARIDLTKINLTVSGDVTADDDFYDFGDATRDIQYESAPGVWSDVSFDGTNYSVSIAGSATLNPVTGLPYTHIDIKIKTKSDAVSDDNENLTLNASIDIPASGDLSTMANISASASTLVSELPLLFVSAPTTVTEGNDAIFEIGLSNIKPTDTLVQLQLSGDFSSIDYDQASFQYSTDDGTTWVTSSSDIQGSNISILGDAGAAKSVLVKISTLSDAVTESIESLVLTATTVDTGISPAGSSASDSTAVVDPVILSLNEKMDDVSTGSTSITTSIDPNFDFIKVGDGANGAVVDNGDGTLTYTANTDFSGADSFVFTKVDKVTGQSFNGTAQVNTNAIADTPTVSISLNNKVIDGLPEVVIDGSFSTTTSWELLDGPGASAYKDYDTAVSFTPTSGEASFLKSKAIVESFDLDSLNYGDSYTLKFDTNLTVAADLTVRFVHIAADNSITKITPVAGYDDQTISTGLLNHSISLTIPDTVGDGTGLVANAIIFENTDNGDSMVIDNVSLKGDTTNTYDVNVSFATTDTDGSEFIQDTITISGAPASAIFSNNGTNVGTDLGGGNWSFTQAQIDGLKITISPSDASTGFTLLSTVTSEESTNGASTATRSDSVIFIDSNDVPLIGDNKLIMANETGFVGTLVDTIDTYFSTDGGNVFSWEPDASTLPVIYADGELVALAYTVTGTDQGTLTGTINGGATTVFTVDITMGDGNATDVVYTQVAELLGVKETFDGGIVLPGGGNNDTIVLGFNDSNGSASGVNAIVTAHNLIEDTAAEIASPEAEHTVNTNNFFIGVNSNNMNAGQQLIFDFATVAADGSGNTTSKNDVVAMEIVLFNFGSEKSGDELFITVLTGDDIATATREDIVLTGDPDLTEQHYTVTSSSGDAFIGVEFLAGNESSYKLGIESISSVSYNTDFDMDLVYTITDADGDSDSGNVVISLDGDEIIIYDASKTSIDAGDEQSSSGGMDTLVFNSGDSIDFSLDHSDILNFEAIDLSNDADTELPGAHSLKSITLQDVLDITDTGNDLRVFGDNGDTVTLTNEWTDTGTVTEGSTTFTIYQSGSGVNLANLMVDTDIFASIL